MIAHSQAWNPLGESTIGHENTRSDAKSTEMLQESLLHLILVTQASTLKSIAVSKPDKLWIFNTLVSLGKEELYMRAPPLLAILHFSRARGGGAFLKPHKARSLYDPLSCTPPSRERYLQGWEGWGCFKFGTRLAIDLPGGFEKMQGALQACSSTFAIPLLARSCSRSPHALEAVGSFLAAFLLPCLVVVILDDACLAKWPVLFQPCYEDPQQ